MTLTWEEQQITSRLSQRRRHHRGVLTILHPSWSRRSNAVEESYPDEVEAYIRRGSSVLRWR